ncbi:hypothetical protein [Lysobacter tyrosinilyticus]
MRKLMLIASIAVLSACRPAATPNKVAEPKPAETPASAATPALTPADAAPSVQTDFAGKVWRVQSSSAGEPGSTYAFLANGELVIDSPHGTPMHGQWRYEDGKLTMVEEGIAYPTDVVKLDAGTFQIRSHNPGGAVDITLVPATGVPLPAASDAGKTEPAMPGSDRDAHGCIPSAGYSWCARTNQCERPWELAKAKGFENTPQGFEQFCSAPSK